MRFSRWLQNDRGASAVLVAASMFLLMGMAAIAVDTSVAFDDRRQQQSAADGGALAALQFAKTDASAFCTTLGYTNGAGLATCRGTEEALEVADVNFADGRYAFSAADLLAWTGCPDSSRPAEYVRWLAQTPCISFTDSFHKARVVLPGTDVGTTFGRIIGRSFITVGAFAEAGLEQDQSADVLPFAVGPTGAGQSQVCLFANSTSNLNVSPCDGPVEGNFGKLDVSLYGNPLYGTPEICGNSSPQLKMAINIALGADHPLEEASVRPATTVDDIANCNAGPILTNPVDHLHTQTGNAEQGLTDGLLESIASPSREGRLRCKMPEVNGKLSNNCLTVVNSFPETLDNTPLWDYINMSDANETVPAGVCTAAISTRAQMAACLDGWRLYGTTVGHPATSNLFTVGIEKAPRFASVPILASDPGTGSGDFDILEFRPLYVETLYLKCNANTCDVVFSPGETGPASCPASLTPLMATCGVPGNGNKKVYALTSFMLTLDMLDAETRANFPAKLGTLTFNLTR